MSDDQIPIPLHDLQRVALNSLTFFKIVNNSKNKTVDFVSRAASPYTTETPNPTKSKIPKMELRTETMFVVPEIDLKSLNAAVNAEQELQEEDIKSPDKNIFWTINYDRFNREFRDQVTRTLFLLKLILLFTMFHFKKYKRQHGKF